MLLCRGRLARRHKHRRHVSCWRNPFLVFFLSFAALGSLRFRVRTKKVATAWRQRQQQQKINNHVNLNLKSVLPEKVFEQQQLQLQQQQQQQQSLMTRNTIRYVLTSKGTTEAGLAFQRYKAVYYSDSNTVSSASSSSLAPKEQEPSGVVTVKEWAKLLAKNNNSVVAQELSSVLRQAPFKAFFFETKGVTALSATTKPFEFVLVDAPHLAAFANIKADLGAFQEHLSNSKNKSSKNCQPATGCRFLNLSGDAVLVAPKPLVALPSSSLSVLSASSGGSADNMDSMDNAQQHQQQLLPYSHLANFVRLAPDQQVTALWQMAASAYLEALNDGTTGEKHGLRQKLKQQQQQQQQLKQKPVWLSTNGMGIAWLHFRLDARPKYYTYRAFAEET
jgi:hypothetical protein